MAFADGYIVAALNDGWIADDLLNTTVNVSATAHPSVTGANMGDDLDLIIGPWMETNVSRTRGDGHTG